MANVLYVKVNPKSDKDSNSSCLAAYFINLYQQENPNDTIEKLDLYQAGIPLLDGDMFSAWGKFASQSTLTKDEKEKAYKMDHLTDQFLKADKIIFSAPFWNLNYPPLLKAYIDTICVAGKTFQYTDKGPIGLVPDKPLLLIETRGGFYSSGPAAQLENSQRYLRTIMNFMGILNFQPVIAEGLDIDEKQKQQSLESAKEQLKHISVDF